MYRLMNRKESQSIRLKQLNAQLTPDQPIRAVTRPAGGWIKAIREALGLSQREVAERLARTPQAVHQLENSEAGGTVTLTQLEAAAAAMGCQLIYTFVPCQGTLAYLADPQRAQSDRALRHSMALEGQAVTEDSPTA